MGLLGLLASWIGVAVFDLFVAAVVAFGARELAWLLTRGKVGASLWPAAAAAVSFPLLAGRWGESTAIVGAALVVIVVSAAFVFGGLRPGAVRSLAGTLFVAFYVGMLASYLVLVRLAGGRLIVAFALMVAAYRGGRWAGDRRFGGSPVAAESAFSPTWWGALLGVALCVLAAAASRAFLDERFQISAMLSVGAFVGIAAVAGDVAGSLVLQDAGVGEREAALPGRGGLIASLHPVLLAAPAFFFGFRLFAT